MISDEGASIPGKLRVLRSHSEFVLYDSQYQLIKGASRGPIPKRDEGRPRYCSRLQKSLVLVKVERRKAAGEAIYLLMCPAILPSILYSIRSVPRQGAKGETRG